MEASTRESRILGIEKGVGGGLDVDTEQGHCQWRPGMFGGMTADGQVILPGFLGME